MRLRMKQFLEYLADPEHQQDDSPMYIFDGTFGDRWAAFEIATLKPCNSQACFLVCAGDVHAVLQGRWTWRHTGMVQIHRPSAQSCSRMFHLLKRQGA